MSLALTQLEALLLSAATGDLTQRLPASACADDPAMARVATALNAFLDKLWLQEFQLQAKQEMLEKVVEIRTREVHEILDNVSSGFLIARPDGTVLPNFSRSCVRIFGREDLEGQPLAALMGLDERARANFQAAWDQVFADFLPLDLCLDQLPADFALDGRSYRMDASPITDATGRVTKLFVTLGDTTELRQVEAQNALRQALLEIVRQRDAFRAFLNETRRALGEVRDDPRQLALRAALHTIKGNLGCFGLHDLAALVHSMEDAAEIRVEDLDTLEETLRRFLAAHGDVVGMGYEDDGQSSVVDLERVVPVLESLAHEPSTLRRRLEIDHFLTHLSWVPAGTLLASLRGVVERVAERLEKEVDLEIGGDDVLVDPETMGPVFSSLVHLVRNSLDHGIEATWERGDKPARGQIAVQCGAEDGAWVVRARDDGRGVDVDALVARAVADGLVDEAAVAAMGPEERLRLIFLDRLTTKDVATAESGRGVGATALLRAVEQLGGQVRVRSTPGAGTAFTVRVPRPAAG